MSNKFYFDHAAATPVEGGVIEAMLPYMTNNFYNPSSPYEPAVQVRRDYQAAKDSIGKNLGVKGDDLVMTAGATESINLAFNSIEGKVAISKIEHAAVLEAAKSHEINYIEVDEKGNVTSEAVKKAIDDETELVSVALANNEIGTLQRLKDISVVVEDIRNNRLKNGNTTPLYFHTDASQGLGQVDINIPRLGVDMLTLNGGKMYAPKQTGLLYSSPNIQLHPLIAGGGQERGLRSGTENVAGVVGFAKALELATSHREKESKRLESIRNKFENVLLEKFPEAVVSGNKKHRLSGHLHISLPGLDAERLIFRLENFGIYVATGSACAANKGTRSHVLNAIGLSPELADGSLRFTFGKLNNEAKMGEAIEIIIREISAEYDRLKK
jgi:cysteine desulfurase